MPVDQLREADLPHLQALARACLDADGGLPLFTTPGLMRARLLRKHTVAIREDGVLLAAAGLGLHNGRAITSGLVAPSARRRGLGTHLRPGPTTSPAPRRSSSRRSPAVRTPIASTHTTA